MGQNQSYECKPLNQLIKDVAQFNILSKTTQISSQLETIMHALVKKSASFTFPVIQKQIPHLIQIKLEPQNKIIQLQEQEFYVLKSLIETLATVTIEKKEEGMCEICFEKEISMLLPCGHSYCENCVTGWFILKDQDSCPMCRAQMNKQRMQKDSYCVPSDSDLLKSLKEQIMSMLS